MDVAIISREAHELNLMQKAFEASIADRPDLYPLTMVSKKDFSSRHTYKGIHTELSWRAFQKGWNAAKENYHET